MYQTVLLKANCAMIHRLYTIKKVVKAYLTVQLRLGVPIFSRYELNLVFLKWFEGKGEHSKCRSLEE